MNLWYILPFEFARNLQHFPVHFTMPSHISENFNLHAYHYNLPEERIAQHPADRRDASRLLVLHPESGKREHLQFADVINFFAPGDLLVVNNTRVFPARLHGHKETGGKAEVFLLEYPLRRAEGKSFTAPALIKASKRPKPGNNITISEALQCTVLELLEGGKAMLELHCESAEKLAAELEACGEVPLPPYIGRKEGATEEDRTRYQTVYARTPGAVAAPTAGLHFTPDLLEKIREKGVEMATVTLHVGYGTFAPVRVEDIREHQIHSEYLTIPEETAEAVRRTKAAGGKVWAVGTTTVRSLEFGARQNEKGELQAVEAWCDLYIYPGFTFRVVDNLITNFHLPDSSLMFLVSAFCDRDKKSGKSGREMLLESYEEAVNMKYRFFSYGDAMAVVGPR